MVRGTNLPSNSHFLDLYIPTISELAPYVDHWGLPGGAGGK